MDLFISSYIIITMLCLGLIKCFRLNKDYNTIKSENECESLINNECEQNESESEQNESEQNESLINNEINESLINNEINESLINNEINESLINNELNESEQNEFESEQNEFESEELELIFYLEQNENELRKNKEETDTQLKDYEIVSYDDKNKSPIYWNDYKNIDN